jgi:hypothetical protein
MGDGKGGLMVRITATCAHFWISSQVNGKPALNRVLRMVRWPFT